MCADKIKLRGNRKRIHSPWPIGSIPNDIVVGIGRGLAYNLIIERKDISGNEWGRVYASAVGGTHRGSSLGIVDITGKKSAWSVKTVKAENPFTIKKIRLISGRNSPSYSSGISDPYDDIQVTGNTVLSIWNARLDEAVLEYGILRTMVLVRNMDKREFLLFEQSATQYSPADYEWRRNKKGNLEGYDIASDIHYFTWQPHGAQFTIIKSIPGSSVRFRIKEIPTTLARNVILGAVSFSEDWIEVMGG